MRGEVLPVCPLLLFGVVVDRSAVVQAMRHVVPAGCDHGIFDFGKMVENFQIQAATRADIMLVKHLQHAPEAYAVAIIHPGIERNVWLGRPALRHVLEELHIWRNPKRDAGITGPFDNGTVDDWRISESSGCDGHVLFSD